MGESQFQCGTCGVRFDSPAEQRQHAKSEWHVYRLRLRTVEPGATLIPPSTPDPLQKLPSSRESDYDVDSGEEETGSESSDESDESEDDGEEDRVPDFVPERCLFCTTASVSFTDCVTHMRSLHGLTVPYQEHLTVDLETLVWYLHMVVHGYHECLGCGARKRTAEAAVQHMLAKGHCRLDVTGELAEFYDVGKIGADVVKMEEGGREVRLADGRVVESRRETAGDASQRNARRLRHDASPGRAGIEGCSQGQNQGLSRSSPGGPSNTSRALQKRARKEEAMTMVLSRLSASDQMSLSHLPASEQRAWLATRKRELDRVGREERRARAKVERLGNKTLMKHFRADAPARANG